MVDNAAVLPGSAQVLPPDPDPDPGGPFRRRRRRRRPEPHPRGHPAANTPTIDITEAQASPVEEFAADTSAQAAATYSTGPGGVEMYHYDRRPMAAQEQTANQLGSAEVAQVRGPGQA